MGKQIFRKAYQILFEEYEVFSNLSLRLRMAASSALALFYFTLVIITHLTIYPYIVESPKSTTLLSIIYFFVAVIAILTVLPILFPSLKKKSSSAIFALIALNFFPFLLLSLLIPKLREHKTAIISIVVFFSICIAGFIIIFEGTKEGILTRQPDTASIILWLIGQLSLFSGIFIYGYVTEKTSVENTRMETEIAIAKNIQSQLVPLVREQTADFSIFGNTIPAYEIGGDFFDVIKFSDQKIILAIGDVSGHNIAAGLLMAITKGAFRTALQNFTTLEQIVRSVNKTVVTNSDKRMFVSFKCCEIDFVTKTINIVNGGHLPLLLYRSRSKQILEYNSPGLGLGLSDEATYQSQKIKFKDGDIIYLLTDGIIEAMNADSEQFGLERIKRELSNTKGKVVPEEVYKKLMKSVNNFTDSSALKDDITFLSMQF